MTQNKAGDIPYDPEDTAYKKPTSLAKSIEQVGDHLCRHS